MGHSEFPTDVGVLYADLAAAQAWVCELEKVLFALLDVQNGPPLPKYELEWNAATEMARLALASKKLST